MQVTLELSGHPKANVKQVVIADTVVVGRSATCGLQIASSAVSRKHCEIRVSDNSVSVIDLGSSNGTFLNSNRLPAGEECPLPTGSRLNIGGVRFVVNYEPVSSQSAPAEAAPALKQAASIEAASWVIDDEPGLVPDEPALSANEPAQPPEEPVLAEQGDAEESAAFDVPSDVRAPVPVPDEPAEIDLDDLFADEPIQQAGTPTASSAEDAAVDALNEPILEEDEDQAFAFLSDEDETAEDSSAKAADDSRLGDFLSQLKRD